FYKNQKNRPYRRTFLDLFREFNFRSARNWWYIRLTLIVSTALLIMSLLGLPRAMWAGIACMSVCLPFSNDLVARAKLRGPYNILGSLIFMVLYIVLPKSMYPYIGIIGGIGVGYSAGYAWQTVFNTFGALSIASGLFGMTGAVVLRIGANVFASIYTVLADKVLNKIFEWTTEMAPEYDS
ncbi:MAG: FUSC family protein, partial [bacterium]|nr:FUSC family protein [bacterium]